MPDYYKKVDDYTLSHDGKTYFEKSWVQKRIDAQSSNAESYQTRAFESERLLLQISKHWFVRFFFSKRISKHIEKYRNHTLKF